MILEEIRRRYAEFTRNQKRIADLISTSYHQVAFMTATQIAGQLLVNEATVIRFAQRLGYGGYPAMAIAIREVVQEELAARPWATEDDELVASLRDAHRQIERAIATLPDDLGARLIAAIESASHIHVLAEGMATHLGGLLVQGLRRLGLRCANVPDGSTDLVEALASIESGDLVIGLCVEGASDRIARAIEISRAAGCATLSLTASPTSPVARAAETSWSCPHSDEGDLPTTTPLGVLIDALLQALALRRRESLRDLNSRMADMRDQLD